MADKKVDKNKVGDMLSIFHGDGVTKYPHIHLYNNHDT